MNRIATGIKRVELPNPATVAPVAAKYDAKMKIIEFSIFSPENEKWGQLLFLGVK